ncbi:ATP-dependent DNA helicase [Edaphobacillus lindanitolerans]|uniref:ATP-dependent DNA helicase DinG n=1 Tax=Edaphobacillus lindanitolerans TaxID=550447 RepID=A0A1U7PKH5_9BACI|nr:ATP-dependent DNA helicase [Edaphobacillus lindanitolerans]SIT66214.1 ATP-dependent DNA helicase DinG [Edaphobacillus lindanitolerans]
MKQAIPFALDRDRSFFESMDDWIGDVLYDELTEKGFDLRDEQVFMAFQIGQALKEKSVLFAEAGVGTGKTIAYLLPAVAYARYTGKPAIIACADEALIDQLVKETGDIGKLEQALGLTVDVRLAKSREQYLCLKRLDEAGKGNETAKWIDGELPDYVHGHSSMMKLEPYGDRSSFPDVSDDDWSLVNYHPLWQCSSCDLRNRCGQTLHRAHYREAADLIICSQDFYMEHLWTKESRIRQEQLPLLPEPSVLVFDEGHLLEYAAQKAFTYRVQERTLDTVLSRIMVDGVREKTLVLMERLIDCHAALFLALHEHAEGEGERRKIGRTAQIEADAAQAVRLAVDILEELVFDADLYVIPDYDLKIAEEYLEQYIHSMKLFTEGGEAVDWLENENGDETLVIMPRLVTDMLGELLFTGKLPVIFSSATMSVGGNFSYLADSLGIHDFKSFSVESPFDYEEVMQIRMEEPADKAAEILRSMENGGQTLVLFRSKASMEAFRRQTAGDPRFLFEGDRALTALVRDFQDGKAQALCSWHLWEGLDIPGEALTRVAIHDMPYPPDDPLFEAKRRFAGDPYVDIDLPYMLLRLRQGIGRLIRTSDDHGEILLLTDEKDSRAKEDIQRVLPVRPATV